MISPRLRLLAAAFAVIGMGVLVPLLAQSESSDGNESANERMQRSAARDEECMLTVHRRIGMKDADTFAGEGAATPRQAVAAAFPRVDTASLLEYQTDKPNVVSLEHWEDARLIKVFQAERFSNGWVVTQSKTSTPNCPDRSGFDPDPEVR